MTAWDDGNCLMRLSVGKDAPTVTARRLHKEAELNAMNNGSRSCLRAAVALRMGICRELLALGLATLAATLNTCSDYIAAKCFPNN